MNSRERVIQAINHQEPDRVPFDINPLHDFYIQLKKHLDLDIQEEIKHNFAMEVIPHHLVLERLGVDLIAVKLGSPTRKKSRPLTDGYIEDDWSIRYKKVQQPGGGSYYEVIHSPLKNATVDDLMDFPWPEPDLPGRGEKAEKRAKFIFENTELALMGRFGGPITETALNMLGMEEWMIRLAKDPEFITTLLGKITEIQIALDRIGLEATGNYLQIFKASGEDLGMQTGPIYSKKMFRNLILPHLKKRFQAARSYLDEINPSVKIMLHSCGSIRNFLPDLIESGVDIIDPVQPQAARMNTKELKGEFGDRLTFHGGIDIQNVLPFGSKEEIEAEAAQRIKDLAPGGGYILAPAHNVQADVPPENVVTLFQAADRLGRYPL
jgi:uroporphyrinogen decarboxylase